MPHVATLPRTAGCLRMAALISRRGRCRVGSTTLWGFVELGRGRKLRKTRWRRPDDEAAVQCRIQGLIAASVARSRPRRPRSGLRQGRGSVYDPGDIIVADPGIGNPPSHKAVRVVDPDTGAAPAITSAGLLVVPGRRDLRRERRHPRHRPGRLRQQGRGRPDRQDHRGADLGHEQRHLRGGRGQAAALEPDLPRPQGRLPLHHRLPQAAEGDQGQYRDRQGVAGQQGQAVPLSRPTSSRAGSRTRSSPTRRRE